MRERPHSRAPPSGTDKKLLAFSFAVAIIIFLFGGSPLNFMSGCLEKERRDREKTMRRLKLQVQMSCDGFIAGPNGALDWVVWDWDDDLKEYVQELMDSVDCIVLGRKLAEGFIPHWAEVAANPDHPEFIDGRQFTEMHKIVFSRTLETCNWSNTSLAKGDLVEEINRLKGQAGKNIIAYGGASFVSALIHHDLIDEYHLFVNPSALGTGMPIFNQLESPRKFTVGMVRAFSCGIVLIQYRRAA